MTRAVGRDWRAQAACLDHDPELFFPVGTTGPALVQTAQAKTVCCTCPVKAACLRWALTNRVDGVWGGLSEDERERLRRYGDRLRAVPVPEPTVDTKTCSRCQMDLPVRHFHRDRSTPDGLHRRCRDCRRATDRARREPAAKAC